MRLGLTMRVTQAVGYDEPRDSVSHDWIHRCEAWGHQPTLIPNTLSDPAGFAAAQDLDLLVLTGGNDIGDAPERDATERALLDHAVRTARPVLGVCRGLQMMNHFFGGVNGHVEGHAGTTHAVNLTGALAEIMGPDRIVNSYHNIAVAPSGLAAKLETLGSDEAGNIEAAGHRDLPILGLMWHPERGAANEMDHEILRLLASQGAFWR